MQRSDSKIAKLFGNDVPVVLRVIEYGFDRPQFSREEIQTAAGLDDATWQHYWQRVKMVIQLDDNLFCLTMEAVAIYLQLISFQHAEREARRANRLATIALIIALVGIVATLLVALGWAQWVNASPRVSP